MMNEAGYGAGNPQQRLCTRYGKSSRMSCWNKDYLGSLAGEKPGQRREFNGGPMSHAIQADWCQRTARLARCETFDGVVLSHMHVHAHSPWRHVRGKTLNKGIATIVAV